MGSAGGGALPDLDDDDMGEHAHCDNTFYPCH